MANKEVISALQTQIDGILAHKSEDSDHMTVRRYKGNGKLSRNQLDSEETTSSEDERLCDAGAALKKIVSLVNVSDKSERTIRNRLASEGFDQNAIDEAVSKAKEYGFIDDARYAEVLVRSRISQCKGSSGIVRELADNGIDADTVDGWPFDFPVSHEEEIERALSVLDRKPPHSKNKREAAYRRLMQKGYPSSVSSTAARIWFERSR